MAAPTEWYSYTRTKPYKLKNLKKPKVYIDKLKRYQGDAPENWPPKLSDGVGNAGFSEFTAQTSPS